ncbi:MAG TPA: TIGR03016 family PEP-CTERM system-associated outer membrane protein [Roseomonas sp.]
MLCAALAVSLTAPARAQPVPFPSAGAGGGGGTEASGSLESGVSADGTSGRTADGIATGLDTDAARLANSPVRLGGIGAPLGFVTPVREQGRAWTVVPSLGAQLLATDNLYQTRRNRQSEFITSFTPGLFVSADTSRIVGSLNYSPQIEFYANERGQDRVDHNFAGQALATLVPGFAYLDVRGLAGTRTATGGFSPEGTVAVDRNNRVQTTSFQASPYIVQRFGGLATAQLGYAYGYSAQEGEDVFLPGGTQPYFTSQNFTSNEVFGVLRSGEDFGRLNLEARGSATTYSGSGVLDDAHRTSGVLQVAYALTRSVAVLVEGGYESQRYSGNPPIDIEGPIWSVGARLTPDPYSTIVVRYGRRDGFNSASLEADVALGARTQLSASYADRLTTDTLRNQDLLSVTSLDATGQPFERNTGAPISFGEGFLGTQDSLRRVRRAALAVTRSWTRDRVTLSVFHEEQEPVSVVPGTVAFSQRGVSGSLSWAHELTPSTSAVAYAQYGTYRSAAFGSGDVATLSATLFHQLTPRLTASLQYALTHRSSDNDDRSLQNIILVALRQEF